MSTLLFGALGGLISCLSTCAGALPSLYHKQGAHNLWRFISLDFTLGMMLSASAFSLILPAYKNISFEALSVVLGVSLALVLGVLFIRYLGERLARLQERFGQQNEAPESRAWLFVIAMMIHNFPEGLAAGASLNVDNLSTGVMILASISLQNIPEGLMTALAFRSLGMSSQKAFLGAAFTGGMEFFGGVTSGLLSTLTTTALPFMLAFAGGAMLFVSAKEAWEQTQGHLSRMLMKPSFALGFMLMTAFCLISF